MQVHMPLFAFFLIFVTNFAILATVRSKFYLFSPFVCSLSRPMLLLVKLHPTLFLIVFRKLFSGML